METQKYEQKDMTGTLWLEVQTKDGKDGPYEVCTGSAKIFGQEMWLNGYPRETKTGKKLLSLSFKLKNPKEPLTPMDAAKLTDEPPF